ncbi:response regulator [Actinospongicola halichondriae]|uniref:response regulator n=1 Tax=Actinospongicola halichondriae TaxID=3236844 RepID=UPI003D4F3060
MTGDDASAGQPRVRVLVVEDEWINRRLVIAQLERLDHDPVGVETASDALAALRSPERVDIVLMDWQLPDLNGLDATRRIRSIEESTGGHVPIIGMTARTAEGDREACLDAGMDDFLPKPIVLDELEVVIERWRPVSPIGP